MPENKHTPGNFGVIKNLFGNGGIFIVSDQVEDAIIAHMGEDVPDADGNAQLFAAAPDMLAALVIAESTLAACYRIQFAQGVSKMADGDDNWVLKTIRAAISKAEGKKL